MTQLVNDIYEAGGLPKVKITALKKNPKATNVSNHRTSKLIAHTNNGNIEDTENKE